MRKNVFIFLIVAFIVMPFSVLAEGEDVTFNCPDEIMPGNQIQCKIVLSSQDKMKGILANYEMDEIFSYLGTEFVDAWEEVVSNNQGFTVVNTTGVASGEVSNLNLALSNDVVIGNEYKITLKDIVLSDGEKDISVDTKEEVLKVLSVNDIVDSILVNDIKLEVKDGVTDYTIEVENEVTNAKLLVNLINDEKYQFADDYGSRTVSDLKVGDNLYQIKITDSEARELITYSIHLIRKEAVKQENNNVDENPKTGSAYIIFFIGLLIVSLLVLISSKKWLRRNNNV